jgi:hypothetical protein
LGEKTVPPAGPTWKAFWIARVPNPLVEEFVIGGRRDALVV